MRVDDILFRGKRVDNGEWVYGYLFKGVDYLDRHHIIAIIPENTDIYPRSEVAYEEVDPETVGQYIGRDDIYDDMIFTDDLIECYWRHHFGEEDKFRGIYCVVTDSCIDNGLGYCWPQDTLDYIVVGNKYDNPDIYEQMKENTFKEVEEYRARSKY